MRRGLTIRNQSGMAGVIAAMIIILLNAAIWMVMNTASERVTFQRSIRAAVTKKSNQRIVDNASTIIADYCDALVLGAGATPGPTAPISESQFRSSGLDLSENFRTLYQQLGFQPITEPVVFKAFPTDAPARMPSSLPILSGVQAKLEVGTGAKKAERIFTIPVLMNNAGSGFSISACRNDEEHARCYLNSNALYFNLPAPQFVIRPTNQTPGIEFDNEQTYGRVSCFSDTLRLDGSDTCNSESNTLATGLRICMNVAQSMSRFVNPSPPPWGVAGSICLGIANMPRVLQSCPIGGGSIL